MSSSETEIANLALSHLGGSKEIANIETEKSEAAAACRRFFDTSRDEMLRDFAWPFATSFSTLGLVEEDPDENDKEWKYSYRYPSDCISLRRILSGSRNDHRQGRVPYKIGQDSSGLLIYTDKEDAIVEYTKRETDVSRFPTDFVMALSFRLAAYIAPRVTGGDPFKLGDMVLRFHSFSLAKAQNSALKEEQPEEEPAGHDRRPDCQGELGRD